MLNFIAHYDELTVSEKKALEFIVDHAEQIPFLTISELADKTFVSKTVIINLAQKLGYSGYKELKFAINQQIKESNAPKEEMFTSPQEQLKDTIDKTFALVNETELVACVKDLLRANNIFIMARGTSKPVGYYLEHLLFSLGIHCFFIKDYNLSESFTHLVTKEDVVLFISLSGNTAKIINTAQQVKLKHAKMISLTAFQSNKLASYTDYQLYCHTEKLDTKQNDTISRIGFFVIIDLIIATLKSMINVETNKNI